MKDLCNLIRDILLNNTESVIAACVEADLSIELVKLLDESNLRNNLGIKLDSAKLLLNRLNLESEVLSIDKTNDIISLPLNKLQNVYS